MMISLIVAMSENRVIGRNNKLPWYLPEDLKYFKRVTMGKPIIMGRKTYESIGRPLPGRTNIVITRNRDYQADGIRVVHDLNSALELSENIGIVDGNEEVMIIGGADIFELTLPMARRLYLTQVHAEIEGDTWFPKVNLNDWQEIGREDFKASGPNPYDYSFLILQKPGDQDIA
ncbi:MAG: dihydrofolate reductase [Pseudohongiellaceae bacterium]